MSMKKETRGRKQLPESERKNKRLPVAVSEVEIMELKERAKEAGESATVFIRKLLDLT